MKFQFTKNPSFNSFFKEGKNLKRKEDSTKKNKRRKRKEKDATKKKRKNA